MKSTASMHQEKIARSTLPRLPETYWSMAGDISSAWQHMSDILEREWQALAVRDMPGIWQIAAEKKALATRIEEAEARLRAVVDFLLEKLGYEPSPARWEQFRHVIDQADLGRFEAWFTQIKLRRREAETRNARHHRWIQEQLKTTRELIGILGGWPRGERATYGPRGSFQKPGMYDHHGARKLEVS